MQNGSASQHPVVNFFFQKFDVIIFSATGKPDCSFVLSSGCYFSFQHKNDTFPY